MAILDIPIAEVMLPLLEPARYKGAWGGRQGTKSNFFADLLIDEHIRLAPLRSVCIRETQTSLKESVKQLLEDKIRKLGLEGKEEDATKFFIMNNEIRTPRGGKIIFLGMQNHTADSIKSLEGYDRCWVEEAQALSKRSLEVLRPTIMRKPGAQMWFSWNPNKADDPVDAFLRGPNPPANSIVVHSNYYDNPWLDADARKDIEYDRSRDIDRYLHVWEGAYQTRSNARVFTNWKVEEFTAPDKTFFYLGADWGFSVDPTVLVRCFADVKQKPERSRLLIDHEAYGIGVEIDNTPALFDTVPGSRIYPIVADSARPETISYLRGHGFPRIESARKGPGSVKEGVIFLQGFDIVIHPRCKHVIDEFQHYSYVQDPKTEAVSGELADKKNHCIAEGALVSCLGGDKLIETVTTDDHVLTRAGYRRVLFAGQTDADRETVLVETTHGTVCCTPEHEIFLGHSFVSACSVRYAADIMGVEALPLWLNISRGMVGSIDATLKTAMTHAKAILAGLFPVLPATYIATSGNFITGLSPMGMKSIIRTRTPDTTTLITCSALRVQNTSACILTHRSALLGRLSIWQGSTLLQKHGIKAKKVALCIVQTAKRLMNVMSPASSRVSAALKISTQARQITLIGSVLPPAAVHIGARQGLITKTDHALSVNTPLARTSTAKYRLVPGHVLSVKPGPRVERVYDLTVEDQHEFFANGVLVSNCVDSVRYACEKLMTGGTARMVKLAGFH